MAAGHRSLSSMSTVRAGENNTTDLYQIPILALGTTVRGKLSKYLNVKLGGTAKNWKYLAESLDYETLEIQDWDRLNNPTEEMLNDWGSKVGSSVGKLLDYILKLERIDIIDDIGDLIERDGQKWMRKRQDERRHVQVSEVSSVYASTEESEITVDDRQDDTARYDAFVCYCLEDKQFVDEMIEVLEKKDHLKLYIEHRDLLPGSSHTTVTAELIENRCRRMVVVLSPHFKYDDFNNFCIKFGISLQPGGQSKRVIPVIVSTCKTPSILQHLTALDYTKRDLRLWFWNRLAAAIKLTL